MKKTMMVFGVLVLVLAVSGGAFAAKGLLTGADIKNGSLTGADIKTHSLSVRLFSGATLTAIRNGTNGGPAGATGANGTKGDTGVTGAAGSAGTKGNTGAQGAQGPAGPAGSQGSKGDKGDSGASSPLVFGPYASGSTDSSVCGNDWATDTYTRTYVVAPGSDGSFEVTELCNGSFVTLAGLSPGSCSITLPAGITGKFYGDYAVKVPAGADFNFTATCASGCTTSQFFTTFFGKDSSFMDTATYGWQFHYATTGHGSWDNTNHGNSGNITP